MVLPRSRPRHHRPPLRRRHRPRAALGSGEASNERVTGEVWPRKDIRDARLLECVDVIRRLLAGEEVNHDSLVTVNRPLDTLRQVLDAYRDAGGRGPARLQVHLSWAPTDDEALAIAHDQCRSNVHAPPVSWDTETVEAFDTLAETVTPDQVAEVVNVSSDLSWHTARIQEYLDQGWNEVYLHHVGQRQEAFLDTFGERVLPQLAPTAPAPATTDRPARGREGATR